jgi:hypothetical protein
MDGNAPGELRRRGGGLRVEIQGLDEQCFSSEGFNDEPRMDFPVVK